MHQVVATQVVVVVATTVAVAQQGPTAALDAVVVVLHELALLQARYSNQVFKLVMAK